MILPPIVLPVQFTAQVAEPVDALIPYNAPVFAAVPLAVNNAVVALPNLLLVMLIALTTAAALLDINCNCPVLDFVSNVLSMLLPIFKVPTAPPL